MLKHDKWPGFIPPQLAILVDSPPENNNWVHEIKYDGYRIQVHIKQNRIIFLTRNGHDWSDKFVNLFKEFKKFPIKNAIFDGDEEIAR